MKKYGDSAIYDRGFQFYLTLNIKNYIDKLINEIEALKNCISTHNELKKFQGYSSKTKVKIHDFADIYPIFKELTVKELTVKECNDLLLQKTLLYETIMKLSEESLVDVKNNKSVSAFEPFYGDLERLYVIIDEEVEHGQKVC